MIEKGHTQNALILRRKKIQPKSKLQHQESTPGAFFFISRQKNDYKGMEVKCKTKDTLPLDELVEFQGNLKARSNEDYAKIEKSIKKHGFSFPFFVWHHDGTNHVLDGHGRLGALHRLIAAGEQIPELPVVYVDCRDEAEAKEILLKLNSSYGHMTADSVKEFLGQIQSSDFGRSANSIVPVKMC